MSENKMLSTRTFIAFIYSILNQIRAIINKHAHIQPQIFNHWGDSFLKHTMIAIICPAQIINQSIVINVSSMLKF